jgi:AhpD family alkylhydroperoxidase
MQRAASHRRIYTVPAFVAALDDLLRHTGDLLDARRSGRVDRAWAEKLMLAVTAVNECRYCMAFHRGLATHAGVSDDEIGAVVTHCFADLPQHQIIALAFAQHYAESGGRPEPASRQRLIATYGPDTARDIAAYLRAISVGNLLGNTFDALRDRLTGRPAPGSSVLSEIGVLLIALVGVPAGIVLVIAQRLIRRLRG